FAVFEHERERHTLTVDADLGFESHSYGSYSDSLVGGLAAGATYRLLRDRLTWVAEDNFGQALIESRDTITPDNTQDLNVFSTGPDIQFPLGPRTALTLQGRWTNVSYQESSYGNNRLSADLGLQRRLGLRSTLSINGSTEEVRYKSLPSDSD